jgi:hypothetical protein
VKTYQIVKIGDPPSPWNLTTKRGKQGGTRAAKNQTAVIEVDLASGKVLHRFSFSEAERIAEEFRHPRVRLGS